VHDFQEILGVFENFTQVRGQFRVMRVIPREWHIVVTPPRRHKLREQRTRTGRAQADTLREILRLPRSQAESTRRGRASGDGTRPACQLGEIRSSCSMSRSEVCPAWRVS
jgi:hypothetical protein